MNDRFKFRIWDEKEKRFLDHPQINPLFGCVCGYENSTYPLQIEQCTGLKDKNGNLIYEGDIVKDMAGETYKIIWHNDFVGFVGRHLYQENRLLFLSNNPVKIVGNIHEQAEQKEVK